MIDWKIGVGIFKKSKVSRYFVKLYLFIPDAYYTSTQDALSRLDEKPLFLLFKQIPVDNYLDYELSGLQEMVKSQNAYTLKGEIDCSEEVRGGLNVTLFCTGDQKQAVRDMMGRLKEKPVLWGMALDEKGVSQRELQISPDFRNKINAVINDVAYYTGETQDDARYRLKNEAERGEFSLGCCSKELGKEFFNYLLFYTGRHGIRLRDETMAILHDDEKQLWHALYNKYCVICRKAGTVRTWNGDKICLCDECNEQAENLGPKEFERVFHVKGIRFRGR